MCIAIYPDSGNIVALLKYRVSNLIVCNLVSTTSQQCHVTFRSTMHLEVSVDLDLP
jgi:hypothetical protein